MLSESTPTTPPSHHSLVRRTVANSEGQEPNKSNKSEEGANEGAASMWQTLLDHALSGVGRG